MKICGASPDLREFVADVISRDMAAALIQSAADLSDEAAVTESLLDAGFGWPSVSALANRARDRAIEQR